MMIKLEYKVKFYEHVVMLIAFNKHVIERLWSEREKRNCFLKIIKFPESKHLL